MALQDEVRIGGEYGRREESEFRLSVIAGSVLKTVALGIVIVAALMMIVNGIS